jgi:hypothetical protein
MVSTVSTPREDPSTVVDTTLAQRADSAVNFLGLVDTLGTPSTPATRASLKARLASKP